MKKYITTLTLALVALTAVAEDKYETYGPSAKSGAGVIVRAGYRIGATTPMPLPSEIRSLNEFTPNGGGMLGVDVYKMYSKRWGASLGWHFYQQGFHTSADVKNYAMSLTMDGNTMSGYFTGCDVTNVSIWGMTMPLLAKVRVNARWDISAGPYIALYFKESFSGEVYDTDAGIGYLRVDTPTGEKVNMDRTNPATYAFDDNMRNWNGGLMVQFDWRAMKHMNVFAQLDWGMSDIFEPNFEAVAFKMYPIYGTVGLAYRY